MNRQDKESTADIQPMPYWRAGLAAGGLAGLLAGLAGFLVWVIIAYAADVLNSPGITWREILLSLPVVVVSLGFLGIPVTLLLGGLTGVLAGLVFGTLDGQAEGRYGRQLLNPLLARLLVGVFGGLIGGLLWNMIFVRATTGVMTLSDLSIGIAVGLVGGVVAGPRFARWYHKRVRIGREE